MISLESFNAFYVVVQKHVRDYCVFKFFFQYVIFIFSLQAEAIPEKAKLFYYLFSFLFNFINEKVLYNAVYKKEFAKNEVEYSCGYLIMNWTMDECEGSGDCTISLAFHV